MESKKRVFMKPGRTNDEDRDNFIKFWVEYMKSVPDEVWSKQQNMVIDSQLQSVAEMAKEQQKKEAKILEAE